MPDYKSILLDVFEADGVAIDGDLYTFPRGKGTLTAPMSNGSLCGISVDDNSWIAMDVTCTGKRSAVFSWFFTAEDGRSCGVKMGVLAGIKTRISLPVTVAAGKTLFLRRTPGKLKSVTQGTPIDYHDAVKFTVMSDESECDTTFKIESFGIYDGEPEFPVEKRTLVDEMGQKIIADWPGKTKSFDEMAERMKNVISGPAPTRSDDGRSRWGGDLSLKLTNGNGFFTLEKSGERWFLADPDGYAFFSTGLDCVSIDGECNLAGIRCLAGDIDDNSPGWSRENVFSWHRHNLYRVFGDDYYEKWCEMTSRRMIKWGFNTVACWSDLDFARKYELPHVTILRGYPRTETYIFRDFPDTMSPEFEKNADEWAKQIVPHAECASLIGYFLGNEPNWAFVNGLNIAAAALECEKPSYSRRALIAFMKEKYRSVEDLNAEWGSSYESFDDMDRAVSTLRFTEAGKRALNEFSRIMLREYIRIPSQALRRYDKNHLNLGIRYAWLSSEVLASGSEYTDVFSFNCYSMDPTKAIDSFARLVGKPVMIGEFHFGALDSGLDATGIRGVRNQEERGAAYRYYMHRAAAHPYCLGAHYFTLNDQAYLGRFDGENYQIGIVDVTQRPYEDFESGVIRTHHEIYDVATGKLPPTDRMAHEIPAVFF